MQANLGQPLNDFSHGPTRRAGENPGNARRFPEITRAIHNFVKTLYELFFRLASRLRQLLVLVLRSENFLCQAVFELSQLPAALCHLVPASFRQKFTGSCHRTSCCSVQGMLKSFLRSKGTENRRNEYFQHFN